MRLNVTKCKIMHTGKNNPKAIFTMLDYSTNQRIIITVTTCERDLGILLSNDLKPTCQTNKVAANANFMLYSLKNAFTLRDANLWKKLYICYIRPHLEFASAAWNPYTQKDINTLEKVQHRVTKIIHELKGLNYEDRCIKLGLTTLSVRRTRGDIIQKFKFETKKEDIQWHAPPLFSEARTGHRGQFRREIVRCCNPRHKFFNNRIANIWNGLPDEIINSPTVNSLKHKLDKHFETATGRHLLLTRSA